VLSLEFIEGLIIKIMFIIILQIFLISFFLNFLWEVLHSQLYETCIRAPLKKYISLILGASVKDAIWILVFYLLTFFIFDNINILLNNYQLVLFIVLSLVFSFIDEKVSLKLKRWQYSKFMPKILGIGVTPLLELAITGILTFLYVFISY